MIDNTLDRKNVEQLLRDTSCPDEFIGRFLRALDTGRVNDQLRLLRVQRGRRLELVHTEEKMLDQLDDLRYKLERSIPDAKTSRHTNTAEQHMADGIICLSYSPNLQIPESIPMVSIDRFFNAKVLCVSSDNYGGGHLAAEKLIENGRRHLAFLRIGSSHANEPNKRKDGFVNACEEQGIPYALKVIDDGISYSVFEEFLQEHVHGGKLDFDGIFCVTDSSAHWIRNVFQDMRIRVPDDVQIIGFDGVRLFGDMDLPCSTIVQPLK